MSDPYASVGAPVDPYAQYGAPVAAQPAPQEPSTLMDVLKSFGAGALQGVTSLADITDRIGGVSTARDIANAQLAKMGRTPVPATSDILNQKISALFGGMHTPETVPGEYARTIGQFAPSAIAGPEGIVPKIASVVVPALTSETAGQLTKGTAVEPYARFGGGLIGGALLGMKADPKAIMGTVSPETEALYNQAQGLGVNVRPGQAAGTPFTKVADSVLERLPGTGYGTAKTPTNAQQAEQFTRAVSKTFGENSPVLDQATMASAKARIVGDMKDALSRNSISLDAPLVDRLNTISEAATDNLLEGGQREQVNSLLSKIKSKMAQGLDPNTPLIGKGMPYRLTGDQYQAMRARGGAIDSLANASDPTVAHYARQIRTALDDAFERQSPEADAAMLRQARAQYRNLKTIEPLAAEATAGTISPAKLAARVRAEYPDMATRGAGNLGTLGRIGQRFLKEPPNSGTSERSLVLKLLQNPLNGAAETLAFPLTSTTGRVMRKVINSRPVLANPAQTSLLRFNPWPGLFGGAMALNSAQQNP